MNETTKLILICAATFIGTLSVILALFFVVLKIQRNKKRKQVENYGKRSEQQTDALLKKTFGEAAVRTGVYYPYQNTEEKKYTEIDHLVMISGGVFVIEVKSHNGFIKNPNSHDWWQTYNEKNIRFYNPMWQNKNHVRIVQELLKQQGQYNVPVYSVVLFTSNRVTFEEQYENLLRNNTVIPYIRKKAGKHGMSATQLRRVRRILTDSAVDAKKAAKSHTRAMRER